MLDLSRFRGFEWDAGNDTKSWKKHGVTKMECEETFLNEPCLLFDDPGHSSREKRWYVLGRTHQGRRLFVVFTPRGDLIRVISARDMTRRERRAYDGR